MTAASLAHLPLAAGSAVLATTGRATLWAAARYMRAPLANTGVLALLTLSAMAGSNALYMQRHEHPAPLFAPAEIRQAAAEAELEPVVPAVRREKLQSVPQLTTAETTGSVETSADRIDNADVSEIQRKLKSLQLYDGSIDGLYGPRTARAIRKFEERLGLRPRGELTRELLEAVRRAPLGLAEPEVEPLPTPDPLPEVTVPVMEAAPSASAEPPEAAGPSVNVIERAIAVAATESVLEPLAEPEPLVVDLDGTEPPRLRRQFPETPQQAMNMAVDTAGEAIETIIEGVQSIAMTPPPKKRPASASSFASPERGRGAVATKAVTGDDTAIETASINTPRVGVPFASADARESEPPAEIAVLDTEARPEDLMPAFSVTDPVIVSKVQRGLASLGFLHGPADGIAGEATAKAIRNFEVYYNYKVTGRITPELLDLLVQNGASI
jgi:peptidoglycan hydrolase-like protein with peptidoglycan-binding domain